MIKLVIFDLDGVLVETKNIHFEALNFMNKSASDVFFEEYFKIINMKIFIKLMIMVRNY